MSLEGTERSEFAGVNSPQGWESRLGYYPGCPMQSPVPRNPLGPSSAVVTSQDGLDVRRFLVDRTAPRPVGDAFLPCAAGPTAESLRLAHRG